MPERFKTRAAHFPKKRDERTGMQQATLGKSGSKTASQLQGKVAQREHFSSKIYGTFKTKWYHCYHGNYEPFEFEVQKNDSLALIINNLSYLKQNFSETDSCLLALTTSTSHMQSCFKIDLGFIKLSDA